MTPEDGQVGEGLLDLGRHRDVGQEHELFDKLVAANEIIVVDDFKNSGKGHLPVTVLVHLVPLRQAFIGVQKEAQLRLV